LPATTEQTEELFNDLVAAMREAMTSAVTSQYVLSSIVPIKDAALSWAMRAPPGTETADDGEEARGR
jgi:hypothetical protein